MIITSSLKFAFYRRQFPSLVNFLIILVAWCGRRQVQWPFASQSHKWVTVIRMLKYLDDRKMLHLMAEIIIDSGSGRNECKHLIQRTIPERFYWLFMDILLLICDWMIAAVKCRPRLEVVGVLWSHWSQLSSIVFKNDFKNVETYRKVEVGSKIYF